MEEDTGILLKRIFLENQNKEFLIDAINGKKYSYSEFFSMILRCMDELKKIELNKNDMICVIMDNSIELIVLYFTGLMLGIPIISIEPNKGEDEIIKILSSIKYKILFTDKKELQHISNLKKVKSFFKNIYLQKKDDIEKIEIFLKINYNKLFIITFTSGSTGIPKGVMHSFNNFILSSISFKKKFNFNNKNIFYHNLPMSYIGGILNLIILPLVSESKIVIDKKFNISKINNFWENPIKYGVNTFWFIPTILSLLVKIDRSTNGIEYGKQTQIIGLVGTAPLEKELKEKFQKKYSIHLYESYGLSETFFITTNFPNNDFVATPGKILDNVNVTFSKDDEILIKVPWMFLGYYDLNTNDYFIDGKYQSGDLGKFDEKNYLKITGRKKDIIIKGGLNISPKGIEDFINSLNILDEVIVVGIKDEILGEKIVCMYVPLKEKNLEETKLINKKIIQKLGIEYHIDEFVQIDIIPKNDNGKIDRITAKKKYQNLKR
jgi:long-chain acyl-CoA synthetase